MKKILVIHTFGIGDLIMFTPALSILEKYNTDFKIDFLLTQKGCKSVLENNKNINNIMLSTLSIKDLIKTGLKLRKNKYDISLITTGVKPWKAMIFSLLIGAKVKIGEYRKIKIIYDKMVKYNKKLHTVESNIDLIKLLNLPINKELKVNYKLNKSNENYANLYLKEKKLINTTILGIHPGCNKNFSERRWPKFYYKQLIQNLNKNLKNLKIIVFIGPDDTEVEEVLKNEKIQIVKEKSLSNVAALISKCDYFLNSDSGLGHIASTFQLKKIFTIWGPAELLKTKPYCNNVQIIQSKINKKYYLKNKDGILNCLADLKPDIVFDIIRKELEGK